MKRGLVIFMVPILAIAAPSPDNVTKNKLAPSDWLYIMQKVATGEQAWLNVIPDLAPNADHEQADHLEEALANALPINTKGVLSVLRVLDAGTYAEMGGTEIICVRKVVHQGKAAEAYYNDTRLALLDEPNGAQCLWNLEGVWEEEKLRKE